jgi:ectoine hydroxylase-related dioxygenase (phytanoyl-CoA dioxygenase family)
MAKSPEISDADRSQLVQQGWLKVPGLVPPGAARDAREFIYRKLSEAGFWVDDEWREPVSETQQTSVREFTKSIGKSRWLKPLVDSNVLAAATKLCDGQHVISTRPHHQLLFTAPFSSGVDSNPVTDWTVPASVWHTDCPRDGDPRSCGVQMFTFIDQVLPEGGGMLLISGSHRIRGGRVVGSKELKRSLHGEPFWQNLTDKRSENRSRLTDFVGEIDGIPLSLVELSGAPGDVYFTDLRILHSLTPNTRPRPRLMVSQRLPTESGVVRMESCLARPRQRRSAG